MADRGIIFSAPMVRALLKGRKTQTRRLLTPAPVWEEARSKTHSIVADGWAWKGLAAFREESFGEAAVSGAPYAVGDRLYVRENFQLLSFGDYLPTKARPADVRFAATDPCADLPADARGYPWRPCIHMPRWASRLWLSVTDVRVQRLQDCSEADAIAEGIEGFACVGGNAWRDYGSGEGFNVRDPGDPARRSYATLWNSLHTADGTTWEANPWVVAVTFDVHQGNIDADVADV